MKGNNREPIFCAEAENGTYTIKIRPKSFVLEDIAIINTGVFGNLHYDTKNVSGNCWDNAVAESFIKSLKVEWSL